MACRLADLPPEERFWSRVRKTENCWLWTGYIQDKTQRGGYGALKVNGKCQRAHRFSYELHYGSIPPGLVVMHKCDKPPCVRPDHLMLGTPKDNVHDAMHKGRLATGQANGGYLSADKISEGLKRYLSAHPEARQGERHPRTKLKESQVLLIRQMASEGKRTCDIARAFNTPWTTVDGIIKRKTWSHL